MRTVRLESADPELRRKLTGVRDVEEEKTASRVWLPWTLFFICLAWTVWTQLVVQREIRQLRTPLSRGCVRVEFSKDGREWSEVNRRDARIVRLHNVCSGFAVRVDEEVKP